MKTLEEIIFALEEYKNYVNELELEIDILRKENEKLKKELNQSATKTKEANISVMEEFPLKQIAEMIDVETSSEKLTKYLTILLNRDKVDGRHTAPIINDVILQSCLPQECFEMIFDDIKHTVGKKRITPKFINRLNNLLKSKKLPENLEDKVAEYLVKKFIQKYHVDNYSRRTIIAFSRYYSIHAKNKINELIDQYIN